MEAFFPFIKPRNQLAAQNFIVESDDIAENSVYPNEFTEYGICDANVITSLISFPSMDPSFHGNRPWY